MEKLKSHYVDNQRFLKEIVEYKKAYRKDKTLRIPEYVGGCILQIANHLATKSQFNNYIFKEDMIMEGVENCITYFHNFDPKKTKNPFAYFTTIIYYAFLRRIDKEKDILYGKHKVYEKEALYGNLVSLQENGEFDAKANPVTDYMNDFVETYEKKKAEKKKKVLEKKKKESQKKSKKKE